MNPIAGILLFLVLFAIVMVAISFGSRIIELRSKRQVEAMLGARTEIVNGETVTTSILVDPRHRDMIETVLKQSDIPGRLQAYLQQAGLLWTPSRLVFSVLIAGIVGLFLGWLFRPLGFKTISSLIFGGLLGMLPVLYVNHKRNSRWRTFEEQLPEALDFLARSMRAGHAFSISLEMLGTESPDPLGQEFRALFAEQNLGAPLETALANFAKRVPLLDVRLFVSAVILQRQTGGNLSEILARLSYIIRERFRLRGQVRAASAHGRLTSIVLTILPLGMVVALTFVAPTYLPSMAADSDGKWMIAGAIICQSLGFLIMRRITNIKV